MANKANILSILRLFKNIPLASNAEKLMVERQADLNTNIRESSISETVSLAAAASVNLTTQLPAGAKVKFVGIYLTTAVTLTTAVKLGVGISGTPSAFYLSSTTMTINTTDSQPVADTSGRVAAATTIRLSTVDTSGAAAGTGTGTVKVVVVYEYLQAIAAG